MSLADKVSELASIASDCAESLTDDGCHDAAQAASDASDLMQQAVELLKRAGI